MLKKAYRYLLNFISQERKNLPLLLLIFFSCGISLYFSVNKFIVFSIFPLICILSFWSNTIKKIIIKYNLLHPSQILKFLLFKLLKLIFILFLLPLISPILIFVVSFGIIAKVIAYIKLFVPFSLFEHLWILIKRLFSFLPWNWLKSTPLTHYLISFLSQPFNYIKELLSNLKKLKKKLTKTTIAFLNKYHLTTLRKYIFTKKHTKMVVRASPNFKLSPATLLGYLSLAFFTGFLIIHLHTIFNETTLLEYDANNRIIRGQISDIETRTPAYRLTLKNASFAFDDIVYNKVRIKTNYIGNLKIGDIVEVNGSLFAPTDPASDTGFNFKRWAYYEGISATGYTNEEVKVIGKGKLSFTDKIQNFRLKIMEKLTQSSIEGNLFAITILLGERYALPDESQEIFQKAGISHLLSVSGFHMGLIALITFFIIRYLLMLIIRSQIYDGKKLTAYLTFPIIAIFYLISGMAIPATRSFIMILVFLISVILGRKVLSLNNLALAAFIILLLFPYSLFTAGFQLSFTTTAIIIYAFNKKLF